MHWPVNWNESNNNSVDHLLTFNTNMRDILRQKVCATFDNYLAFFSSYVPTFSKPFSQAQNTKLMYTYLGMRISLTNLYNLTTHNFQNGNQPLGWQHLKRVTQLSARERDAENIV